MRVYFNSFFICSVLFGLIAFFVYFFNIALDVVGFSFLINYFLIVSILLFTLKKRIRSINFVFIFYLLFFCVAPWLQYTNMVIIWSPEAFLSDDYIITNIILFFSMFFVVISYFFTKPSRLDGEIKFELKSKAGWWAVFLSLLSFFIILYSENYRLYSLFLRGESGDVYENISTQNPILSILSVLSRFLPMFLLLVFIKKNNLWRLIIFLLVLLTSFPTGIPRFFVGFIYIPILLAFFDRMRNTFGVVVGIFFSMFILFPFLNQFRYFDGIENLKVVDGMSFLLEGHFDAYQNFMSVIKFDFITYGEQLLGAVLFFIPRSVWEDKPVGSGYALAEKHGFMFNNISMPYLAEGYVNFGLVGVFLFSIILGFFMKKIDTGLLQSHNSLHYGLGVFFCSALFFMQRGDLMTSISIISACMVAYMIARMLVKRK